MALGTTLSLPELAKQLVADIRLAASTDDDELE